MRAVILLAIGLLFAVSVGGIAGGGAVYSWCLDALYPGHENYSMTGPTLCTITIAIPIGITLSGVLILNQLMAARDGRIE